MKLPIHCPSCGGPLKNVTPSATGDYSCPFCGTVVARLPVHDPEPVYEPDPVQQDYPNTKPVGKKQDTPGSKLFGCLTTIIIFVGIAYWFAHDAKRNHGSDAKLPQYIDTALVNKDSIVFKNAKISRNGDDYQVSAIVENISSRKIDHLSMECRLYDAQGGSAGVQSEMITDLYAQTQTQCKFDVVVWGGSTTTVKTFQLASASVFRYNDPAPNTSNYNSSTSTKKKKHY